MFTLHWADHVQNLSSQLRSRSYTDAILVAEDGHSEEVHRLVLSAASEYFAGLLKDTTACDHSPRTTLILPINGKTLGKLVHFVYNGEIELKEADVEEFLEAGRWLGIKGLSGGGNNGEKQLKQGQGQELHHNDDMCVGASPGPVGLEETSQQRELRESPLSATSSIDSIPAVAAFNIERIQTLASLLAAGGPPAPNERVGNESRRHAPTRHHDLITAAAAAGDFKPDVFKADHHTGIDLGNSGGRVTSPESAVRDFNQRLRATDPRPCPKCGKVYRSAHTLRTHLEDKHTVCPGYRCVLCGTIAKSRNSLHSHMSRQHRGISTKDLPLVEVARGGSGGGSGGGGGGATGFDGPGHAHGHGGSNKKDHHRTGRTQATEGVHSFGDVIQAPNLPPGLLKGQPTTTGSAILDTYLHFIAENSLAAAAAFGHGHNAGGSSMSNNTGSDLDSDDENGFGGSGEAGGD